MCCLVHTLNICSYIFFFLRDADSVNNAPGNMDQEIPRSLREMMRQKEDAKLSNRKRKKKIREQKFSQYLQMCFYFELLFIFKRRY